MSCSLAKLITVVNQNNSILPLKIQIQIQMQNEVVPKILEKCPCCCKYSKTIVPGENNITSNPINGLGHLNSANTAL